MTHTDITGAGGIPATGSKHGYSDPIITRIPTAVPLLPAWLAAGIKSATVWAICHRLIPARLARWIIDREGIRHA